MSQLQADAFPRTSPSVRPWLSAIGLVAGLFLLNQAFVHGVGGYGLLEYYLRVLTLVGISIILAVSLTLVNGCAGQFSIGHAGFMAIGAYAAGAVTHFGGGPFVVLLEGLPGWPVHAVRLLVSLTVGAVASGLAGWLVGLPTLRLRGDYLAIVTLGFGEIIRVVLLNIEPTGGALGFTNIAQGPDVPGQLPDQRFALFLEDTMFFWVSLAAGLTTLAVGRLAYSSFGRSLAALRENEIAAAAMGIDTTRAKTTAFVISAVLTGIAGGLYAHYDNYLNPGSFTFLRSVEMVTMIVLGGLGSISGAIVGAATLTVLPEALRDLTRILPPAVIEMAPFLANLPDYRMVLYSLLLIGLMIVRPQGLFGRREWAWLARLFR
ncbi:branched-chain amino acid ABC transporter permease [Chloracidobacterium thermophilum]|uniref:branched-chain amino acid ABC transporter permease n=1 Tax=Chloracidobacterium thermophilum TaxID=458033 RepID=UPI0007399285|nr:branched-chain amino acid ABC transporter permease [Chloracidobacterium thermophilum]